MKKPTIDMIYEYMLEREFDNYEEAEAFFDHHESGGWKVGKNPMVKWKNAVNTWIKNAKKWGRHEQAKASQSTYQTFADRQREQAATALAELEAMEQRDREVSLRVVR